MGYTPSMMSRTRALHVLRIVATVGGVSALAATGIALSPRRVVASGLLASRAAEALVTVGTPTGSTPQNVENEPALAVDAAHPDMLVAGANDFGDSSPCPRTGAMRNGDCRSLASVWNGAGISAVYFSFDRGHTWVQPS